jgi:hypothetical protein
MSEFQPKELDSIERENARRSHRINEDFIVNTNAVTVEMGHQALKTLVLMNGGALIAMLAFLSSIFASASLVDVEATVSFDILTKSLLRFAFGLVCSALAMAATYFTNYCYTASAANLKYIWRHPYLDKTPKSRRWVVAGAVFHIITIAVTIAALVFFILGFLLVRAGFAQY